MPQTNDDLNKHLNNQLGFLESSCDAYDQGNYAEGKRIAATLRILFHDTKTSISLASQLDLQELPFLSTCCELIDNPNIKTSQKRLISIFLGDHSPIFYVP